MGLPIARRAVHTRMFPEVMLHSSSAAVGRP
ncbi:hypothetical protein CGMCC3_g3499 [Colletotrichum fructicola]|nr:uncharacterized protein CGMCC3_g3499 [Colletotrichum fructicola]KAE9580490.1 hypothetical protein CGMCC3_g3499 [Colletotrichum fructicola]